MGALFGLSYHLFSLGKVLIKSQTRQTLNDHQKIMKKFEGDFMKPNPRVTVKITISGKLVYLTCHKGTRWQTNTFLFSTFSQKMWKFADSFINAYFPPRTCKKSPWISSNWGSCLISLLSWILEFCKDTLGPGSVNKKYTIIPEIFL